MAPWVNIGVVPNGDYVLCCVSTHAEYKPAETDPYLEHRKFHESDKGSELYIGSLQDNTLSEIWNNDKMRDIRIKMLKGEPVGSCGACYYSESITDHLKEHDIGINIMILIEIKYYKLNLMDLFHLNR